MGLTLLEDEERQKEQEKKERKRRKKERKLLEASEGTAMAVDSEGEFCFRVHDVPFEIITSIGCLSCR